MTCHAPPIMCQRAFASAGGADDPSPGASRRGFGPHVGTVVRAVQQKRALRLYLAVRQRGITSGLPIRNGRAASSSGFQVGLCERLNDWSLRVLFAVSERLRLDAGDQGHIDGSGTEARGLIADIKHRCRGAIIRRQPQQVSAERSLDIYDMVHRRRLGRRCRGCGWSRGRRWSWGRFGLGGGFR